MAKKKKDNTFDTSPLALGRQQKGSSAQKQKSSSSTKKSSSSGKKAYQSYQKSQSKKSGSGNTFLSSNTNNTKKSTTKKSTTTKSSSSKSSYTPNKSAYKKYQQSHSKSSSGSTFLSENANKRRTGATTATKSTTTKNATTNRYAQNKTLNQQEAERGMGVVNRYKQKNAETAKQNQIRANNNLKENQTNEHKSLLTGAKNTNQQEAMRGLSEANKIRESDSIADKARENAKAKLQEAKTEKQNKLADDKKLLEEKKTSRKENMAKFNGTTATQREIEDQKNADAYNKERFNANRVVEEQDKREGKMSNLTEASPMSLARRNSKDVADKQDAIQSNKDVQAIKDTTTGTLKQVAGGYLKTLGDVTSKADSFEQTRFLDAQTQKKNISAEQKTTYKGLKNAINTEVDFTKEGGYYNPVYDAGKKLQASGDTEVNKALDSTKDSKFKNLGLQTYSAILGNMADRAFGPVWAVSMASRTYGNTIDSTQGLGANKGEDRKNALLQAAKEVSTEYLFAGFGAASKLTGAGALFEKSALGKLKNTALDNVSNKVGQMYGNVAKNLTYSGGKMLLGGTEEATEELIGGVLDAPISNFAYGNSVDARNEQTYRERLMESSDNILDRISNESASYGINESELKGLYSEQINSDDFLTEQAEYFVQAGFSEADAEAMASNMQKYLSASLSGNTKEAREYEDALTDDYMKQASVKQKFSVSDTLEAMTVAYMMTAVTGVGGTVQNQYRGAQTRSYQNAVLNDEVLGTAVQKMVNRKFGATNAAQALCNVASNTEDSRTAARVQAMKDVANNGGELALEQYAELQNIVNEQQSKNFESIQTANNLSMRNATEQGYSIGAQRLRNGTAKVLESDDKYNDAVSVAEKMNETFDTDRQLDETQIADVSRAIANTQLGNLNAEDIACLASSMVEERAIYEEVTGEKLPQVLNSDGSLNSAETNKETREYLVAKSAANFVEMAKTETDKYANEETRGRYESRYMNDMGAVGQNVLAKISGKANVTSETDYNAQMRQMQRAYDAGRAGADITAIKKDIVENYGFSAADVEQMYQAGKLDASGYGVSVRIEDGGQMENTHSNRKALKAIADTFGVNIVVTNSIGDSEESDSIDNGVVNGFFDHNTNTMYLNNYNATRNIGYTLMHELTHSLAKYDRANFAELASTFESMWKERNPEAYEKWTNAVRDRYHQADMELTDEEVMEEIICDQMGEILHDKDFMNSLVEEHRSVAEIFLNLIKNAIRKLKELFGLGDVFDSRYEDATLSEFNLLKDAETFLSNAIYNKRLRDALNVQTKVSKSLSMPGDEKNTAWAPDEADYSEKENSAEYEAYLENAAYEESVLPEALVDSILTEIRMQEDEQDDEEQHDDVKEYYPRISPWVEQKDIDIKAELSYAAEQIAKGWKKEERVTGGRVLDEKSVRKKVNDLINLSIGQFKLSDGKPEVDKAELKACSEVTMNALKNAWYEMHKPNPDMDVVSEILLETAEYLIPADTEYNLGEMDKERNDIIRDYFKSINWKHPLIASRWIWEDKRKKRSINYTRDKKGWGTTDYSIRLSHPPGNRWETMRLLQHDTSGMFAVRYAEIYEEPNWETVLTDLYQELGYDEWKNATAQEYWDIRSEEDAIEFLVDMADNVFHKDTNTYERLNEDMLRGEREELCRDMLTILNADAESWNSIADTWKAKYDNLANRLKAEVKAARKEKTEAVQAERAKAKQKAKAVSEKNREQKKQIRADEKAKANKRVKETREKANARVKTVRETERQKAKERVEAEKQKARERVDAVREKMKKQAEEKAKREREKEEYKKQFKRVTDEYTWFASRLQKKEKTLEKNIPEGLRIPLATALSTMDIQSGLSVKAEERSIQKTGRATKAATSLKALRGSLEAIAKNEGYFYDVDLDGRITLNPVIENSLDYLIQHCEGVAIRDMDAYEVKQVANLLAAIRHEIQEGNKTIINGRTQEIAAVQNSILAETANDIKIHGRAKTFAKNSVGRTRSLLHKVLSFDYVTPISFFKNMGGTMESVFNSLMIEAENDYFRFTSETKQFVEKATKDTKSYSRFKFRSKLKNWTKEVKTFKLASGKQIELDPFQIMTLYCEAKQKDALDHMLEHGIYVNGADERNWIKQKFDTVTGVDRSPGENTYTVTKADIAEIILTLNDDQKNLADEMQRYMNETLQKRGNDASMEMYNVALFTTENYFPMNVIVDVASEDSDNVSLAHSYEVKTLGMPTDVGGIPNPKWTQSRTNHANGALVIGNALKVFTTYANQMNVYASSMHKIKQIQKICGNSAVREQLNTAYGDGAYQYIDKLIRDYMGQSKMTGSAFTGLLTRGMNAYKRAAISTNLSVLIQQGTALVRAFVEIGPVHLLTGKTFLPRKSVWGNNTALKDEMFKYCPLSEWKFMGNHQLNFSRSLEDIMMNDYTMRDFIAMGFYEKADMRCWLHIWQMIKHEQHKLHPDMKQDSEEFLKLCGERATYIFGYTQTVDSPLHRPQMMRDSGALEKAYSSFMSEPLRTYNIFRDSLIKHANLVQEAKYLKEQRKTVSDKAEQEALKKQEAALKKEGMQTVGKMLIVLAANGIITGAAKAFVQAMRKLDKNADDDDEENDDEKYWSLWWDYVLENTKENLNIIKQVPFGDTLWDALDVLWECWTDPGNTSYIDILFKKSDMLTDWMWNPITELQSFRKNCADGDATMEDYLDMVLSLFTLKGYGFANAKRDTLAIANMLGIDFSVFAGTDTSPKSLGSEQSSGTVEGAKESLSNWWSGVTDDSYGIMDDEGAVGKFLKGFGLDEGSSVDNFLDKYGLTLNADERAEKARQEEIEGYLAKGKGKTGDAKDQAIYSAVTNGWKTTFSDGETSLDDCYSNVEHKLDMLKACGVSEERQQKFIDAVTSNTKSMYKQEIGKQTKKSFKNMDRHIEWLTQQGWSAQDISEKIVAKSETAREFKCALKMGDVDGATEELTKLYDAGMTDEDALKAYNNRNRVTVTKASKYWVDTGATGSYTWPVQGTITSYYGYRDSPTAGASSNHEAIDIAVPEGTSVGASDGGTVVYAGWNGGYGYCVKIDHGNGVQTQYSHLSSIGVSEGSKVAKGQEIAKSGNTGTSTGPHLDFKMWINGNTVDPLKRLRS